MHQWSAMPEASHSTSGYYLMIAYLRYLAVRAALWAVTIYIAVTVVFVVPHLVPGSPLSAMFNRLAAAGGSLNAPEMIAEYSKLF
jgi:ABC-type dipeptide/oligopeptide/nickel transport system permease component